MLRSQISAGFQALPAWAKREQAEQGAAGLEAPDDDDFFDEPLESAGAETPAATVAEADEASAAAFQKLGLTCAACAAPLPAAFKFCPDCGEPRSKLARGP